MAKKDLFEIKFAEPKHAESIEKVYKEWLEFKGILPDELIKPESKEEILNDINQINCIKKYIIAENEKKEIVGVCYIDTSFITLNTIRLGNMIIKKEYRRKGVGSSLIDYIINFANKNNVYKIWLWTQEELIPAIKLYEKKGFVFEGKQKAQFCEKDALLYGLVLKK
ncbi:MAG: GNAT family N-acetyltransferase [Nanoarchaeota archaeon]|nr:GNAT family N-acetyltransferase [Nanoarchaeota archaeon]